MHQRSFLELKDQVGGVAVVLILVNGVPPCLPGHGVLQLCRDHGNAVQRQNEVKGVGMAVAVMELPGDSEAVGPVPLHDIGVHAACGAKVGNVI